MYASGLIDAVASAGILIAMLGWMTLTSLSSRIILAQNPNICVSMLSECTDTSLARHLLGRPGFKKKRVHHQSSISPSKRKRRRCHWSLSLSVRTEPKRWHTSSDTPMGSLLSRLPVCSRSRSRVTWPQKPAQVVVHRRGSLGDTEPEKISLRTLIESRCPSVLTPFKAAWWLFKYAFSSSVTLGLVTQQTCSGHLQTGYSVVGDFSQADPVVYDRFVTCAILL